MGHRQTRLARSLCDRPDRRRISATEPALNDDIPSGSSNYCGLDRKVASSAASENSVKAFAGPEYEKAVYYPEDRKFLLRLDPKVIHYEVLVGPSHSGQK